ncbi:MAG: hypothetical protein ABIY55_13400 [Kofleriaceae bacterium]
MVFVAGAGCKDSTGSGYMIPPGGGSPDAPTGSPVDARADASGAGPADAATPDGALIGADLAITITATPTPVDLSSTLTYRLDVTNHGDVEAADVVVTQNLPAGNVAFLSAVGIDWTCTHDGQQVVCKRSTLHLGAAPFIEVKITTPPNSGSLTTTVNVTAATSDPVPNNNDAIDATMVLAPDLSSADLSVVMVDSPDPVQGIPVPGCGVTACTDYTIDVSNAGPDVATQLQVTITLPGQGQFFNCVGAGWVCPAPQSGKVIATRPSLAIGAAPSLLLTWKAPSPGGFSIQVGVAVTGSSTDRNPTNDTALEDTTVKP